MSVSKRVVFLFSALCAAQTPRPAAPIRVDRRIALVIGNGRYPSGQLVNAANDAEAMASALRKLGFEVLPRMNLGIREMSGAVDEFASRLRPGDLAFFYYSGQAVQVRAKWGMQVQDQNFLIPVDLQPTREDQITYSSYSIFRLLDALRRTGARVRVIVLDARSDYPLQRSGPPVSGLASMPSTPDTLISYASAPNRVAEESPGGRYSPFTSSLLRELSAPEPTLYSVFDRAQVDVRNITGGRQVPYVNHDLIGDVYLTGRTPSATKNGGGHPSSPNQQPTPPPVSAEPPTSSNPTPGVVPTGSSPPSSGVPPPQTATEPTLPDMMANSQASAEERIARFGNIEAPDQAPIEKEFSVVVSLTREKLTNETSVVSTGDGVHTTAEGALDFACAQPCVIDAVLFAPGFDITSGSNTTKFRLEADRDAPPARFTLKSRPGIANAASDLTVDLWHDNAFIAKIKRRIAIGRPPVKQPEPRITTAAVNSRPGMVPDLTVRWEERDVGGFHFCQVTVEAPGLTPQPTDTCTPGDQIEKFLEQRYQGVLKTTLRGTKAAGSDARRSPQQIAAQLRGLGRELYDHFATASFRAALQNLRTQAAANPGEPLTIQIDTNNPALPWELMVPCAADECGFLGIDYQVARWHISDAAPALSPQTISGSKIDVLAPHYQGAAYLPSQQRELAALTRMPGYQAVGGRLDDFRRAFQSRDAGILHFAGHGQSYQGYQIRMEDSPADPTMLRGWSHAAGQRLYFWNACDSGQENTVAGFVDGWAPALLENGAAGFIGGLWPLGDAAAADFAERFYQAMKAEEDASDGASVARLVQLGRRRFLTTGDPTYLAYVFYGDVRLRITK
jgi:hypothetical protein